MKNSFVIGVTGGIGSGKSSVARLLAYYCLAPLIDLDLLCRDLLAPGGLGSEALSAAFGQKFFDSRGQVDRAKLRQFLFADADFRQHLDSLLHPLAQELLQSELSCYHESLLIFVEIPLLFEVGWQAKVTAVLTVYARPAVQCCRIMQRDKVNRRAARQAMGSQMSLAQKKALADYVIDNSGNWEQTRLAVVSLGDTLAPVVVGHIFPSREESA